MRPKITRLRETGLAMLIMMLVVIGVAYAQDTGTGATSYSPVDIKESFASIMARMKAAKSEIMKRQTVLLNERYESPGRGDAVSEDPD